MQAMQSSEEFTRSKDLEGQRFSSQNKTKVHNNKILLILTLTFSAVERRRSVSRARLSSKDAHLLRKLNQPTHSNRSLINYSVRLVVNEGNVIVFKQSSEF